MSLAEQFDDSDKREARAQSKEKHEKGNKDGRQREGNPAGIHS